MRRWTFFLWLLFLIVVVGCKQENPMAIGFVQGEFAYISDENRVLVLNITDEARPELVANVMLPGDVVKVVVDGRFLYIAHTTSATSWDTATGPPDAGLQIVEISEPAQPMLRGFFPANAIPTDVAVRDDVAYLADWDHIAVVDVRDKDNPTSPFLITGGANSVFVGGARLYASSGGCSFRTGYCGGELHIYDVTNPVRPYPITSVQADQVPGHDVVVADEVAFVAGKGLWIVDLQNEDELVVNGRYAMDKEALYPARVVVQGEVAYNLNGDGLHLLDISQPTTPTLLGQYSTDNYLHDLTIQGDTAYLIGWNGLEIVDIADSANPQQIGSYAFANPIPSSPQPTRTQ